MKNQIILTGLLWLVLLSGCTVYSLHPLYTEEDLLFNKNLEGNWIDPDSNLFVINSTVSPEDNKIKQQLMDSASYTLVYTENGKTITLSLHLLQLGSNLFLDFYPTNNYDKEIGNDLLAQNLLPVHIFGKIEIEEGELRFYNFNGDWLEDLLKSRKIRISHEEVPYYGRVLNVLTASTSELQKFMLKYQNEKDAFEDPLILTRVKQ